ALAAQLLDIAGGGKAVVGAVGDGRVVVAGLGGAAVTLHVHAPGIVAARGKELHDRGIGTPSLQVEGRLRRHRGAVHEQNPARRPRRIAGILVPQEQTDIAALVGPVLLAADGGGRRNGLVHALAPNTLVLGSAFIDTRGRRHRAIAVDAHVVSPIARRKTLHCVASTSIATSSPILNCCSGWV